MVLAMKTGFALSLALALAGASPLVAQTAPDLPPVVARLLRTYAESPDGAGFFDVRAAVPELGSTGLWVRYGDDGKPPVRIDRATGVAKVIGRPGSGPNEYRQTGDIVAGPDGLIGVRDVGRMLLFWVDAAGVQRRTWSVPTTDNMQGKTFADAKGRVYIGRTPVDRGVFGAPYVVRVDSARGLVDTMRIPFKRHPASMWSTRTPNGATQYYVQFAPAPDWGIDRQGRLYSFWSDSNFIQIGDGKATKRLWLPAWREPLSAVDRKSASDRLDDIEKREKARNAEFLSPRPSVPQFRSQILDVMPDLAGGIVARRSKPCASFRGWKAPITGATPPDSGRCGLVERFDASGTRLAPFTITGRDQVLAVRADTVWIARRDEDDLVKILELVIPKR